MKALRYWWRHRNDPPPMLPDPVTVTRRCHPDDVAEIIAEHQAEGWTVHEYDSEVMTGDDARIVFRREDGAYRWRDDAFKGY